MTSVINLNVDVGESFGNYAFGNDAALISVLPTLNVACGAHAGDPHVIRRTVELAAEHGADVGAHVGLPDLVGFGRRAIAISPAELYDLTLFQVGALDAFVRTRGLTMTHVKPHGALYAMCTRDERLAGALIDAVAALSGDLRVIVGGTYAASAAAERGVAVTSEGYVDLDYRDDGTPIVERRVGLRDPAEVAARAVRLVTEHRAPVRDSASELVLDPATICLHGDSPNAPEIAVAVVDALRGAGFSVVGLVPAMDARALR